MSHPGVSNVLTEDANSKSDNKTNKSVLAPSIKRKRKRKAYRSRPVRITIAVVRLIVLGYATILVSLILMETRIVYPGAYLSDSHVPETDKYPEIETVEYRSTDGITLRGRLIEREQSSDFVLFFHGNGEKAKWLDAWLYLLSDEFNATVMVAEYRGFADDETPSEKGVLADCFSARNYLCERFGKLPPEIILYGRSLGGGCAVAIAAQGGAKALVLDRTFDRLVNIAANQYPIIPVNFLMRNRYDSIAKLTVYKGPLIQLHGTTDELIPIQRAQALFASAPSASKHWIAIDGLGHNDTLPLQSLREIVARVREFTAQP
jgi:fermentation-respiration switch protein FrsA (DUF1100 family)